jgi:hypothetical protein
MESHSRPSTTRSLKSFKFTPPPTHSLDPQSSLFSPASAAFAPSLLTSTSRLSLPRGKKRPLIVKKSTQSVPGTNGRTTPLFPTERRSKRYQKSESEEELLNVIKCTQAVLPMPTPDHTISKDFSAQRTAVSPDKQKIASLESKLQLLSAKYKKLEGSYRVLLVRSSGRDSAFSPDSDHTHDSVQLSLSPRQEPITEVLHLLKDLKAKIDRVEVVTSALWSRMSRLSE